MNTGSRARTRSTRLGGLTNLFVLAPLRSGMVPSYEPISYVARLRKVLEGLHAARQNLRESEALSGFPDVVGRFGIIHNFRYALVPPESMPHGMPKAFGTWRLSLNVTFDGGWEPYMRVIYRDIGPLLDLLFCHSPDYPGSRTASFEKYCDWVRTYEVDGGIFYTDSGITVSDGDYLGGVEALQRGGAVDEALARHRRPSLLEQRRNALAKAGANATSAERALALPFRTLKGLFRLSPFFPRQPAGDDGVLLRFAQHVLDGPIAFMNLIEQRIATGAPSPELEELKLRWETAKKVFAEELDWLQWKKPAGAGGSPAAPLPAFDASGLQAHILGNGESPTHGCLVLLRVEQRQQALATIAKLAHSCGSVQQGGIGCLVGFTYGGLQVLGVTPDRLDLLPQDFYEGMEARHALLGDLRTNHPDNWTRPALWQQDRGHADLGTVHLLVQLRIGDEGSEELLHPALEAEVEKLATAGTGLRVLAVEPTRVYKDAAGKVVGHLGIADGLSQPKLPTGAGQDAKYQKDEVPPGELLLGYGNARGDAAPAQRDPFLHDGTFLVVRKLRLWTGRIEAIAPADATGMALRGKMVGRAADGAPLHGLPANAQHENDFDFSTPAASDACPFHSHIRRANPRDQRDYTPRILRRGMSYGPKGTDDATDRGVIFMAYCASLCEQFETLQRWIAGGNSSGVGSAQGDPLLRVPQEGEPYTFRYLDGGHVQRRSFDDKPLTQLQWGLYAFVPSLAALRSFEQFTVPAAAPAPAAAPSLFDAKQAEEADREQVRALVEDRDRNELVWRWVRERHPNAPQGRAYGKLLGRMDEVLDAMKDADGSRYSVQGYGVRKAASIGPNLLGMDPLDPVRIAELGVKTAIESMKEPVAFATAQDVVARILARLPVIPGAPGAEVRRAIDLVNFSDFVLGKLCEIWFGLPDGTHLELGGRQPGNPATPRCPGNLGTASRFIFTPHPRAELEAEGKDQGAAVRKAVTEWLADGAKLGSFPLSAAIEAALGPGAAPDRLAANIAGTMLGFTPTVQGNFLRVMETWISEEESLWEHQQALFAHSQGPQLAYAEAVEVLRPRLFAAMRKHPAPALLWRSPVQEGKVVQDANARVVLGMQSALTDPQAPDELVFGRDRPGAAVPTVHGCPGYEMAMGVLLAMIGGLLKAGTLQPTGSPVLLILK